ncbi:tRNA nucleotidyltransferase [Pseudoalteromonas tunicata]|uniref:tRNA nucleotidyltransferase n=1 Tax=Pseudoalteromonas tunicata TaxID=314281 RepID=UPI00273E8DDF|nr:tRNA nucleotidyltransferase [Pseudoalteromonas tunicata]MDP4984076.1 tRNA nucleotidyltransferase [Pseudoalteromonas tunicata]
MQIYLVGGAVRDTLLGRPVLERDFVVVGATAEQMLSQGYTQVGKDFPVFLHPKTKEEYALARTERKQGQGYTGFICDFNPNVTLEEDLIRRDLTVNAIAQAPDGQLIDPYNGQDDLNNRILRHVSGAFAEDPLRILRVARFAARYHYLGFTVAPETITLMQNMVTQGELKTLTAERVWIEWEKSLNDGAFATFLSVLQQVNALSELCPSLSQVWSTQTACDLQQQHDYAKHHQLATPEVLFCQVALLFNQPDLAKLKLDLKLPNSFVELAQLSIRFNPLFMQPQLCASEMLACFNALDLWRRPERLTALLAVFECHLGEKSKHQLTLESAAKQASSINAQTFIKQGITGAAIKPAMDQARLTAIAAALG